MKNNHIKQKSLFDVHKYLFSTDSIFGRHEKRLIPLELFLIFS